jgi:glycerol-3-phosphate O-acyltransferase
MLGYYRNPINFVFFNESIVVCAINSFGAEQAWKNGIPYEDVFSRACYLSELLKREEVLKERIKPGNKQLFDKLISFMQEQRILAINPENKSISLKGTGEATLLFIGSICWPMIDTYYVTLLFALSMVKQKNILDSNFPKDV